MACSTSGHIQSVAEIALLKVKAAHPVRGSDGGQVVHGSYPSAVFSARSSGHVSEISGRYEAKPIPIWRMLDRHEMRRTRLLACASAGSNREARIAMIAITTSNSISVKA